MSRLQEVKKVTKEWLSENINILKQENISLEVLIDNENCLRILLETKDKMGEILVEEPSFAPYKNFKFEIAQIIDNQAQIVNAWYDNENTHIEDYKLILDNGMVLM